MKKIFVILIVLIIVGIGGYFYYQSSAKGENAQLTTSVTLSAPTRPAEITGYIVSALGNSITIAKEIGKEILSEEEQAAKKAKMQSMSPEERQTARQEETANMTTEDTEVTIPVGVPVVKGTGDASGNVVSADIADLAKGVYVSIWIDQSGNVEYVKIKGI